MLNSKPYTCPTLLQALLKMDGTTYSIYSIYSLMDPLFPMQPILWAIFIIIYWMRICLQLALRPFSIEGEGDEYAFKKERREEPPTPTPWGESRPSLCLSHSVAWSVAWKDLSAGEFVDTACFPFN